ncbi:MAG: hypothetical protein ACPGVK_02875 [Halocynthiibacter sp.]
MAVYSFTIITSDAFDVLSSGPVIYRTGWEGIFNPGAGEVPTVTVNDTPNTNTPGLAAVGNNSAVGPDTDPILESVLMDPALALNDSDSQGGTPNGQTLANDTYFSQYGITAPAGSVIRTLSEHRFEEYDENGNYIDDFWSFAGEVITPDGDYIRFLIAPKPLVPGNTYRSTDWGGYGTVAASELVE